MGYTHDFLKWTEIGCTMTSIDQIYFNIKTLKTETPLKVVTALKVQQF